MMILVWARHRKVYTVYVAKHSENKIATLCDVQLKDFRFRKIRHPNPVDAAGGLAARMADTLRARQVSPCICTV